MKSLADLDVLTAARQVGERQSLANSQSLDQERDPIAKQKICPLCKDMGFVLKDVPVDHPDFGKLFPCQCKQKEMERRRAERLRKMSNLDHLDHMTFTSFVPEGAALNPAQQENLRRAFSYAQQFAREPQDWLMFRGGYGCGKTHLAAAIANERLNAGKPALFVVVPDLLDYLRSAYSPNSSIGYDERFEEIRSHPLLILDDLGTQSNTSWADEKLFQIFNYRYNAKLPTVITTNCELEEIEERIRSRLNSMDLVHVVPIFAPDYRASGISDGQSELSSLALHLDKTFSTFDLDRDELDAEERENLRNVSKAAQDFAQHPEGWLLFIGTYGCGKTHLAAAIGNYRTAQRQPAIFIVVPDLLDHLRATFSPQSTISYDKLFEQIRRAPLLILDDLGTESATAWAREKLYQLFNYRHNACLPTVITTAQPINEIDPRIRARLLDRSRCQIWSVLAPAYRGSAPKTQTRRRRGKTS
ncbi:MAG: ATP-binding protein [Anaerolineae bacterium]|nr:ATP-binding protein [Anaerolineae bacterium]